MCGEVLENNFAARAVLAHATGPLGIARLAAITTLAAQNDHFI